MCQFFDTPTAHWGVPDAMSATGFFDNPIVCFQYLKQISEGRAPCEWCNKSPLPDMLKMRMLIKSKQSERSDRTSLNRYRRQSEYCQWSMAGRCKWTKGKPLWRPIDSKSCMSKDEPLKKLWRACCCRSRYER